MRIISNVQNKVRRKTSKKQMFNDLNFQLYFGDQVRTIGHYNTQCPTKTRNIYFLLIFGLANAII